MDATTVNTAISACAAARRADEAFRLQALYWLAALVRDAVRAEGMGWICEN